MALPGGMFQRMSSEMPGGDPAQANTEARLAVVTDDRAVRGDAIARRRTALGLYSISAFARRVGKNRDTIAAAEAGRASDATYAELEAWLDDHEADGEDDSRVEFEVTGPRTDWHVVVRGPAERADELRRQVVELLREVEVD